MMRLYFLIISLFIYLMSYSQNTKKVENDTLNSIKYVKGIYRNFNKFKSNSPNFDSEFTFKDRTEKQIWAWGGTELEIKFTDDTIKKRFINDSIWAVSDGRDLFLNNKLISINKGFDKLVKLDFPISYFVSYIVMSDENKERAAVAKMFGAIGGGFSSVPYKRVVAIDLRTGEMIRMNDYGFSKLLSSDDELMEKYKTIRKQKYNELEIFKILEEYNSKNRR